MHQSLSTVNDCLYTCALENNCCDIMFQSCNLLH